MTGAALAGRRERTKAANRAAILAAGREVFAEHQSTWVGDYLAGRYALPAPAALRADIERERRAMFKRYIASKRHTMQIDFDDYLVALAKERKAGEERARAQGHRQPVAPRAAAVAA